MTLFSTVDRNQAGIGRMLTGKAAVVGLLAMGLLLGGCSKQAPVGSTGLVSLVQSGSLPVPEQADRALLAQTYLIGPLDKLRIDTYGISELAQRTVQVDSNGDLSYPIAGTLSAAGKTPAQLKVELEQRLRAGFVRNPIVTVNVEEVVAQRFTVEGQVRNPGNYPVIGKMTLLKAVASANGTADFASLDDVVLFRTVGGKRYAALYDFRAIRRGNYADPEVFANDIIVVNDAPSRRLFEDFLAIIPLLTTPLIVALQN